MKNCGIFKMNTLKLFFSAFILPVALLLSGCWKSADKSSSLVIINVLDKNYFDDCHITGSVHIPFEDLEKRMSSMSKDDQYVFYCSNYACTAAPFSAKMFKDAGFKNVYLYPGGIVEWYQKGYPCQGPAKMEYLKEDNEPLGEEDEDVPVLTPAELKSKMEKFNLLK